jgi:hypothetical protein
MEVTDLPLPVLLFVFWYCHKRGKEVRLEREKSEDDARVEELAKEGEPSGGTTAADSTPTAATPTTTEPAEAAPVVAAQENS